jgi:predicted alpha/beta hydrolase family esterase
LKEFAISAIVVSHMFASSSADVWYPQLGAEFGAEGHQVLIPDLPDPHSPDPQAWLTTLAQAADPRRAADTVLVGHSLGGVSVLRLLERHDTERFGPYAGLLLVASMAREVGYDALAGFFQPEFDWPRIRRAVLRVRVLHAADDPVTAAATPDHVTSFAVDLGATVTLLPDGGHLPSTGHQLTQLPHATRLIRDLLPTPN